MNEIVGGYTLDEKWIEEAGERGLWMPTLYIDPKFRNRNLSPKIIEHARKLGAKLGYEKIFLTSEHVNYYERFGFHMYGPDYCAFGDPTQMFWGETIPIQPEK